jgi:hypothetical protein
MPPPEKFRLLCYVLTPYNENDKLVTTAATTTATETAAARPKG